MDEKKGDPALQMAGKRQQSILTDEQKKEVKELQATTYLNLAICHKMEKNYKKMADTAGKAVELKATIKGFYNLGLANKM